MSYALVDNATLTAVQRILGKAPTKSRDNVDIDIIALENFLQAVLFYDEIIVVDDYKDEFKDERRKDFPFARFIDPNKFNIPEIGVEASKQAHSIHPLIQAGEIRNEEYQEIFKKLKTQIICTWDVASSVYYLTLKALSRGEIQDKHKFSSLAASIFSELNDSSSSNGKPFRDIILVDKYGSEIKNGYEIPHAKGYGGKTGGMTPALNVFVASLNWLVNKTAFYTMLADHLKADTFLYPTRQAFQPYYLQSFLNLKANYSKEVVEHFTNKVQTDVVDMHHKGNIVGSNIKLPMFSAWAIQKTNDPKKVIEEIMNIRQRPEVVEARARLRNISNLINESGLESANKERALLLKDLDQTSKTLREKYSVTVPSGIPIANIIKVFNWLPTGLGKIPELEGEIPIYLPDLKKKKGFSILYQDLSQGLANVWSLNKLRNSLGSCIYLDSGPTYNAKFEDPDFKNFASDWKAPM